MESIMESVSTEELGYDRHSPEMDKVLPALMAVQKENLEFPLDATGKVFTTKGNYEYKYTKLSTINKILNPVLTKNDLLLSHQIVQGGTLTTVYHTSGQFIRSYFRVQPGKAGAQALGAIVTYGKRYNTGALFNCNLVEDDDGASGETNNPNAEPPKVKLMDAEAFEAYKPVVQGYLNQDQPLEKIVTSLLKKLKVDALSPEATVMLASMKKGDPVNPDAEATEKKATKAAPKTGAKTSK